MTIEDTIRQIIREENEKFLQDIAKLLELHTYKEQPRFLTVPETAEHLRMGRSSVYELVRQAKHNGFSFVREGYKIRISYSGLVAWIDDHYMKSETKA